MGEQDLRRERPPVGSGPLRPLRLEGVDEFLQTLLQHVVAEIHDEVVVTEELSGDEHAVRQARAVRPEGCT